MADNNSVNLLVRFNFGLKWDYGSKAKERKNSDTKDCFLDVANALPLVAMLSIGFGRLGWSKIGASKTSDKVNICRGNIDGRSWSLKPASCSRRCLMACQISTIQNRPDIRYLRPIDYSWVLGALYTTLDVIGSKPEIRDNFLVVSILSFPTPICWSKSVFGALGNPSNALDLGGCLLGMAFTIGYVRDPSNVRLWHVTVRL
jgi:hypothetical protein